MKESIKQFPNFLVVKLICFKKSSSNFRIYERLPYQKKLRFYYSNKKQNKRQVTFICVIETSCKITNDVDPRGFVKTLTMSGDKSKETVFALDCEMCYTTHGIGK